MLEVRGYEQNIQPNSLRNSLTLLAAGLLTGAAFRKRLQ